MVRNYWRGPGGGMGYGFRGWSPPWPYVGRGRGGLPRCAYYAGGAVPASPEAGEAGMLRARAESLRRELEQVEARLRDIESRKG